MPKHQKENEFQNVILILMIIIVLFIIIAFGYYYIREKQKDSNTNINDITSNNVNENTIIEDDEQTSQNTINDTEENVEENIEETEEEDEAVQEIVITKTISPRGFAGASNYNLCLYSDKTVYLITYNGEGYTEKDISSKKLLAENVEDIYYDDTAETMYIVGGNKVSDGGVTWIEYK